MPFSYGTIEHCRMLCIELKQFLSMYFAVAGVSLSIWKYFNGKGYCNRHFCSFFYRWKAYELCMELKQNFGACFGFGQQVVLNLEIFLYKADLPWISKKILLKWIAAISIFFFIFIIVLSKCVSNYSWINFFTMASSFALHLKISCWKCTVIAFF